MKRRSYSVTGMSCEHCERAVVTEVSAIAGVDRVIVDLPAGEVVVESADSVDDTAVIAAIDEAGYQAHPASA